MAGAVEVQVAKEDLFDFHPTDTCMDEGSAEISPVPSPCSDDASAEVMNALDETSFPCEDTAAEGVCWLEDHRPTPPVARHSRLAPHKPGKMTIVLDMDECLLHSKFHGPGAASEAYRQSEERPDAVNEVNSFWVALDDGDTAQVNKRPGLDAFLEALARDYNTIVFTAAMPDYAGPVLDFIDPKGTLFYRRLYRSSCRQVKGAFLKDLSVLGVESTDMSRIVLVDNNPLSFICQPSNGVLVASFYDDPNDTALASVMQLIRHLDHAGDVRPILKDMFCLDALLGEYRNALFDEDDTAESDPSGNSAENTLNEDGEEVLVNGGNDTPTDERHPTSLFEESDTACGPSLKDDDDNESVETEACSEESGESSLGEALASTEEMEMEMDLDF